MDALALIDQNSGTVIPFAPNRTHEEFIPTLLSLLQSKDAGTRAHVGRVHELTAEWITYLRGRWELLDANIEVIEIAAVLHDVGKVAVLDEVLMKKTSLTEVERDHLEQHSEIGYQMLRDCPGMDEVAEAVRHHHERWDGGGYPLGLRERQIPLASRMIAIVDAYDAIVSERPYKSARPPSEAINEISQEAGRQFCPTLATQFIQFMYARNT